MVYQGVEITAIGYAIRKRVINQRKHFSLSRAEDLAWLIRFEAILAEKEAIQITRKEVNNNMKLIRRIENPGDTIVVVAESATHFIGANIGDADKAEGVLIYSYSKTHYHVIGEVYESKVEK